MPIYEYHCDKCGTFEATQRITDKALNRCPTCKGKVKKLISNTSFQLKGTGWYITDYARKDKSTGKSENGSASKSDSKPASEAKSEAKEKPSEKKESKSKSPGSESSAA
ncbi:MAG TPA: FmdB family zinc ribbon protein [Verrucomicrobiae bacterium]|jgi:putative FmdB family regulatory protein|nr:FmdB family zinc ribbon protein [Verrucomicrobiae bacterium]